MIRIRFVAITVVVVTAATVIIAVALVVASAGAGTAAGVERLISGRICHLTTRRLLRCTGAGRGIRISR